MKKPHVLTVASAFVSVLMAAQAAVAGEQGIVNQQRAAVLDIAGSLPTPPAQWRADRFLATPSLDISGGLATQGTEQASGQLMIPAQWRADRFLATPSLDIGGGHGTWGKGQSSGQLMIPPQWRADRFLAMPSLDIGGSHGTQG